MSNNSIIRRWVSHPIVRISAAILLFFIVLGYFFTQQIPDPEIRVAQVCALSTQTSIPSMDVIVTLYDKNGHQIFAHPPYQVQGNEVELQGNVIAYRPVVTYKLTSLQGRYEDHNIEQHNPPTPIPLSKGEDSIYPFVSNLPTVTPSSNSLLVQADGHLYNIYVTANGLFASRVNGPLGCGLNHQAP